MAQIENKAEVVEIKLNDEKVEEQLIEKNEEEMMESEDAVTIFSDPSNFNIKHPLQSAWTFWYDSPSKKKSAQSWSQNLKKVITIDTVEDFWGVFNNITKASELANGSNYHLFKEGIKPEWEDEANQKGGKWVFQSRKGRHGVDDLWLYTLLASIGESFELEDELNGVVFSSRRELYRISIWTRTSESKDIVTFIGNKFKEVLGLKNETVEFCAHNDAKLEFSNKGGKYVI